MAYGQDSDKTEELTEETAVQSLAHDSAARQYFLDNEFPPHLLNAMITAGQTNPGFTGLSRAEQIASLNHIHEEEQAILAEKKAMEQTKVGAQENTDGFDITALTPTTQHSTHIKAKNQANEASDVFLTNEYYRLQNDIVELENEQTEVQTELTTIYDNIADFRASLPEEDLEILDARLAGKPLVVVNATLEGGEENQSYVVYQDENNELYIKNPQDDSPVYVKDLNDPQINEDITNQRDRFEQEFGNENPELAARFEWGEAQYQKRPDLKEGIKQATQGNQFKSIVRNDQIKDEITEKQTKIENIEQEINEDRETTIQVETNDTTDQPTYERNFEAEAKTAKLTQMANTYKSEIGNNPVNMEEIRLEAEYLEIPESDIDQFTAALEDAGVQIKNDPEQPALTQENTITNAQLEQQEPAPNTFTPSMAIG